MTGFELLDHTSEIGFEATGDTLDELFANSGRAVFQVMTDIDQLDTAKAVEMTVESENLEALLFDFIDHCIYLSQAKDLLLRVFDLSVTETPDGYRVTGTGRGQLIGDELRLQEVKAPTYSDIVVEETGDGWRARMFLDI